MRIPGLQTWRMLFHVKGVYNVAVSVGLFFGEDALRDYLGLGPTDPIYRASFLILCLAFGLGYWWVGNDPTRNHDILRMGIVGQVGVFLVSVYGVSFAAQRLPWPYLVPGVVDVIFAVAFLVFLCTYPRGVWPEQSGSAGRGEGHTSPTALPSSDLHRAADDV